MRIAEPYKDKVLAATDIVKVIGGRIELKRAGREYAGCCPFHEEKSASFYVNPAKQVYKCQGCGAAGSVIRFLMQYDGVGFHEAIETLAKEAGMLPLQYEGEAPATSPARTLLYAALENATAFFQEQLLASAEAQAYCASRGLSADAIKRFRLGWAPASWDSLGKALSRYDPAVLISAGLLVPREKSRPHDRFRSRLMFPILDRRGRVIAFGGRVIDSVSGPKYLNSPETELFRKSEELFGLWQALHPAPDAGAPRAKPRPDEMIVVEGYTDVVVLHLAGITNAVATLGTAMSASHAGMLFPLAPNLVFCFDGDAAGTAAAWRALDVVLPHLTEGRAVRFAFLPKGEDPDSLVRRAGAAAFDAQISAAIPLSEYLFLHLEREYGVSTLEARARVADRASALIRQVPEGFYQRMLQGELERRVGATPVPAPAALAPSPTDPSGVAFSLLGMLMSYPALVSAIPPGALDGIDLPGMAALARAVDDVAAKGGTKDLQPAPPEAVQRLFAAELAGLPRLPPPLPVAAPPKLHIVPPLRSSEGAAGKGEGVDPRLADFLGS